MTTDEAAKNFFGLLILAGFLWVWIRRWPWETLQLVTISSFAVAGLLIGGWLVPRSRLVEGTMMIPATIIGFLPPDG